MVSRVKVTSDFLCAKIPGDSSLGRRSTLVYGEMMVLPCYTIVLYTASRILIWPLG